MGPAAVHRYRWRLTGASILALLVLGCASQVMMRPAETGVASYYGDGFHGRTTANGERFDRHAMTAAHRTLEFGTTVRVMNLDNGREVVVRINDRGPFVKGRIIDLSQGAATKLGMIEAGLARVRVKVIEGRIAARK